MSASVASQERARWLEHRRALDPLRPQDFFTDLERDERGRIVPVATLFLTNHGCPWRCVYCDLWKNTLTGAVPVGAIPAQVDFALSRLLGDEIRESSSDHSGTRGTRPSNPARQIKLYNAGSFFDPKAIPPEDFSAIAERVGGFRRVIVECHPALVGNSAVRFRDSLLASRDRPSLIANRRSAATLEVAMGLEIADDAILDKLNKRMTLAMFRQAAKFLVSHDIAVRAFVIVKPPFVRTDEAALDFARRSIDFAFDGGATVVSLIPARFGAGELDTLAKAGDFAPPQLETLEAALGYGVSLGRGRVFADLWNVETLGGCRRCLRARVARLRQMNWRQELQPGVDCACRRAPGVPPGQGRGQSETGGPSGTLEMNHALTRRDAGTL